MREKNKIKEKLFPFIFIFPRLLFHLFLLFLSFSFFFQIRLIRTHSSMDGWIYGLQSCIRFLYKTNACSQSCSFRIKPQYFRLLPFITLVRRLVKICFFGFSWTKSVFKWGSRSSENANASTIWNWTSFFVVVEISNIRSHSTEHR